MIKSAVVALLLISYPLHIQDTNSPYLTAGEIDDFGIFDYRIENSDGLLIPGRFTFVPATKKTEKLLPNEQAAPADLAIRDNVLYTLSGQGALTLPPGQYTVYASHGLEFSIDSDTFDLQPGATHTWTAKLKREVDTTGWVSGDFHLHTLTYSGHGDSNMTERIISFVGEGVDFAVATDHNYHTDYQPTINELGANEHMTSVVGNEVSTPIGHMNAFPLDADSEIPDHQLRDAETLFALIREQPNEFGVVPVVQVNHPRWGSIDYFGQVGLDPVTGQFSGAGASDAFDSIEVFNENVSWGLYDIDVDDVEVRSNRHSAVQDWYNLLNRGHRSSAVGNSDSHTVRTPYAGYPRNYMPSDTDDPSKIDPKQIVKAVKSGQLMTTTGPFATFTVNDQPMGSQLTDIDGTVELALDIRAASWISVDRARIIVNGDEVRVLPITRREGPLSYQETIQVPVHRDSWILITVEGDQPLEPILEFKERHVMPVALTNPVRIDADGDGVFTPPSVQGQDAIAQLNGNIEDAILVFNDSTPALQMAMLNAASTDTRVRSALIEQGLQSPIRMVRLTALRTAEDSRDQHSVPRVRGILRDATTTPYVALAALRTLVAIEPEQQAPDAAQYLELHGSAPLQLYSYELETALPGNFIDEFLVVGYFPSADTSGIASEVHPPEQTTDRSQSLTAKQGEVRWKKLKADSKGYLSLLEFDPATPAFQNAITYAETWINAPRKMDVHYTFGSDDSSQIFVNGALLLTDPDTHGANPVAHIGVMPLNKGWNHVLVKVANASGSHGFYLRLISDDIQWSYREPAATR